jgi:hypothetical protein
MYVGPLLEAREKMEESAGLASWLGDFSFLLTKKIHEEWTDIHFAVRPMLGLISSEGEMNLARRGINGLFDEIKIIHKMYSFYT